MEVSTSGGGPGHADDLHTEREAVPGDRRGRPRETGHEARRFCGCIHVAVKAAPFAKHRTQQWIGRIAMEWETPEFVEVSLACEISAYANAELSAAVWSGTEALDAFRERLAPA